MEFFIHYTKGFGIYLERMKDHLKFLKAGVSHLLNLSERSLG